MSIASILENAPKLALEWASERDDRQQRTEADPADYEQLRQLGIPLMGVPVEFGGFWENLSQSARPMCTMLRMLAKGDPSITLSSAMHQGVLASWRLPSVPEPFNEGFQRQRKEVFETVIGGAWWGTIVSEPGSGGDTGLTRSQCIPDDQGDFKYRLSGQKHFGSGSGLTSFMTTRAVAEGESTPDLFFMEVRNQPWDGSTGMRLSNAWRGHGMMSTNSHAFEFQNYPATRIAWPGHQAEIMAANNTLGGLSFTSVITGVVDAAIGRDRRNRKRMAVIPEGRASVTHYETVEVFPGVSLVEVRPVTGRTHQIRVHLTSIGHPLVGDTLYSNKKTDLVERQFLHAEKLAFELPSTGKILEISSPLPSDLQRTLDFLRKIGVDTNN